MFFTRNPIRFTIRSRVTDETDEIAFKRSTIQLEYWHPDADQKANLVCERSMRRATAEKLDPAFWKVHDQARCGRLRVVELEFDGELFTKSIRRHDPFQAERKTYDLWLDKVSREVAKNRQLDLKALRKSYDDGQTDEALRAALASRSDEALASLRRCHQESSEPERHNLWLYDAIVRQEVLDLHFRGPDSADHASLIVQLNYA